MIGLNCLPPGFVQSGINIASVTTIMVAKYHATMSFAAMLCSLIMSKIGRYVSYRPLYAILSCVKRFIAL